MDLVSIIIPSYNSEKYISQTIQSVIDQTHKNWELIIVDDCSTDNTEHIAGEYVSNDNRIKFFRLSKNQGSGVARNYAVEIANGNYIAFLDSDDLWKPEKLEKQLAFMKGYNLPFTFSFYECIDEAGDSLNQIITTPQNISYRQLYYCNWIGNLTGIYSVDYFGKLPVSSVKKRQDWILWLTLVKQLKQVKPVPESLAYYRIRTDSLSSSKWGLVKHNFNVYRYFYKRNLARSVFDISVFLYVQLVIKPRYKSKKG